MSIDNAFVNIPSSTTVWNYVNILPGAQIGERCIIGSYTEIGQDVKIGNDCKIEAKVFIPKGVEIGDQVFIGPCTCFTNDRFPNSRDWGLFESTYVGKSASIGAGSTIRCGINIGQGSKIGAGSVVTKDVPPGETWCGNPAKKMEVNNENTVTNYGY